MEPRAFESLGNRGQIGRLRRLARAALARYGLQDARLSPLRHEHNTTFRVDARAGPYILRINRPGVHTPETVGSEMAWLRALREDVGVDVPEPVSAHDGSYVVLASDPGVPQPRVCALLRRLEGRFVERRLTAAHLRRVGQLQAALQDHAEAWTPPTGFVRPRVDALTTEAKIGGIAEAVMPAERPAREDADRCLELVATLSSPADAAIVSAALEVVRATTRELAAQPRAVGLIHGDLHQENYLFEGGKVLAIDFDDCGWGFFLYDVAVTLSELEDHPRYAELRAALLDEYATRRPFPRRAEEHLTAFTLLRRTQLMMWGLESRDHPAFRDTWRSWLRQDLRALSRQA